MKKRKGKQEEIDKHYQYLNTETGEITQLEPEFCLMSRRPGLGKEWLEKYKLDTDKDYITIRGQKMSLPKYYDNLLEQQGENITLRKGVRASKINPLDNTIVRNRVKEKVKIAQTQNLNRNLEEYS